MLLYSLALIGIASCNNAQHAQEKMKPPTMGLTDAAFFGNVQEIKAHIAHGSDLNQKDAYGSSSLHIAALFNKSEVAKLLINGGANINEKNAEGSTPLHTAAFFCRTEIVKELLNKGADVHIRNYYNATALESISAPFDSVEPIYDQMQKDLGPLGLKLDYTQLKAARPVIADLIKSKIK